MKIGIISDTHGCAERWETAYTKFFQDVDLIIHAGDVLYHGPRNPMLDDYNPARLAEALNSCPVPLVIAKGNCDAEVDAMVLDTPLEAPYTHLFFNGRRIIVTHGHRESVAEREQLAKQGKVNLVITGHTHIPIIERHGDTIFMNPGSPSLSKRPDGKASIAIADDKKIEIIDIDSGEVLLSQEWQEENINA